EPGDRQVSVPQGGRLIVFLPPEAGRIRLRQFKPSRGARMASIMSVISRKKDAAKFRAPCLALVLLAVTSLTLADRVPRKVYTTVDGLAHNDINKIVRDSRGFLWFCTGDGLSRFDGYMFTTYGTDQGLPHREVNDFLETRSGEYWVATNAGLVRF